MLVYGHSFTCWVVANLPRQYPVANTIPYLCATTKVKDDEERLRDLARGCRGRESTVVSMGWLIGTSHATITHYAQRNNWLQKINFIPKNPLCNQIFSEVNLRFYSQLSRSRKHLRNQWGVPNERECRGSNMSMNSLRRYGHQQSNFK